MRVSNSDGILPLHYACMRSTPPTVEYLYKLYPDAINHATTAGFYPIHCAMMGLMLTYDAKAIVGNVQFLLDCDPHVKLQKFRGMSLLCYACGTNHNDASVEIGVRIIKVIYDAYPEAIEDDLITSNIHLWHEQVQAFINGEIIYARQARDHRLMTTPDENGQLPLHRALQNNARLGSIKLLLKGNRSAPNNADNDSSLPLHLACQYHDSPRVIEHLIDLQPTTLRSVDSDQSTVLHYACRGANYSAISLLLEKYDATSVSMRNVHNELPKWTFSSRAVQWKIRKVSNTQIASFVY